MLHCVVKGGDTDLSLIFMMTCRINHLDRFEDFQVELLHSTSAHLRILLAENTLYENVIRCLQFNRYVQVLPLLFLVLSFNTFTEKVTSVQLQRW